MSAASSCAAVGKIYGGRRALARRERALRAGPGRGGAGPERRRQDARCWGSCRRWCRRRAARCAGATSRSAAARRCARASATSATTRASTAISPPRENLRFFCALYGCDATPARVDRAAGARRARRRARATPPRGRSRAACCSGWRWRARWPTTRRCCCSTSRAAALDPAGAAWLRGRAGRRARRRPHRGAGDARSGGGRGRSPTRW